MQEIQSFGGGTMFEIVDGDRRLRARHHAPALKCPRCDSMNTKFCYYNNYNLSQPRHFCKTCRRYWTKGGVLRNVPIGGGCRKNKRYKPKRPASNKSLPEKNAGSNSSGESSSSLIPSANTSDIYPSTELLSGFSCSSFMIPETSTSSAFDSSLIDQSSLDLMTFPDIGGFSSLISDSSILSYDVHTGWPFQVHQSNQEGETSQEWLMISAGEDLNAKDREFPTELKDESRGGGSEPSIGGTELMFLSDTVDQACGTHFE